MDILKRISGMYNLPIWGLYRLILDLAMEVQTLRRQVANAAKDVEKAA